MLKIIFIAITLGLTIGCQTLDTLKSDCKTEADACLAQAFIKASKEPRIGRNEKDKVNAFYSTYVNDIKEACDMSSPEACGSLAYYEGFIAKNKSRAKELYSKACSLGDTYSCYLQVASKKVPDSDRGKVQLANEFAQVCKMSIPEPANRSVWILSGKGFKYGLLGNYVRTYQCEKYLHSSYFQDLACAKEEELKDMKRRTYWRKNFRDTICVDTDEQDYIIGYHFYPKEGFLETLFPFEKFYPTLELGKNYEVKVFNLIGEYGHFDRGTMRKL